MQPEPRDPSRDRPPTAVSRWQTFLQRWVINTVAVLVAVYVVGRERIDYTTPVSLFIASLLLGILNSFLRPILILLTLPLFLLTLGLFTLVINASLLYLVGWVMRPEFEVKTFAGAFWGALIVSLVSLALNSLTGTGDSRVTVKSSRGRNEPPRDPPAGGGPIIDV